MKCGIDPGLKGAIAFIGEHGIMIYDMPVIPKAHGKGRQIAAGDLARILRGGFPILEITIEAQWARPGQGSTSSNSVAFGFGIVMGVVGALGYSHRVLAPATWKRRAALWGRPKETAITVACQLYPAFEEYREAKNAVDRAEALLLAHFGAQS